MLQSLHVKNLALMEETEITFGEGLNILTGETGAGKSLLIGSVNLALGGKFEKDMLRKGAESAMVELVFSCEEKVKQKLMEMDLELSEDDSVIISRKMQVGKSTCKINGETVTARQVKELAEVLIDIHGQHEHQSLLHKKKHMEILDAYCGEEGVLPAAQVKQLYAECKTIRETLEAEERDEQALARERALAEFELSEITEAKLVPGEDEQLEQRYRLMTNSKKITESLLESYHYSGNEEGAGSALGRALRILMSVTQYDERLEQLAEQLSEVESLLSDYNREVADYLSDCEFDEDDFKSVEDRLNTLNHLKGKYGRTLEDVLAYGEKQQALIEKLDDYDAYMEKLKRDLAQAEDKLAKACGELSNVRRKNAVLLTERLTEALVQLNFLTVDFEVAVREADRITEKGADEVEFLISTNPGESRKALSQVASGGELSRIMLAIKTIMATKDDTDTLIFDEIDAGISGKTAWKVAEQLSKVAAKHQVLCITHLPQIAAMADTHFVIEKSSMDNSTMTDIYELDEKKSLCELARLLGSDSLTEAALENARQMRSQALSYKQK
ncbi:MAG: DNA repair protein RecN [Lachnospiraceae bacterium]|nr:DNA repair protein RecN [Lachnospiraceae bacterium]